uniref:Uncharacterized protein n=1 Tax=Kalanchoe fedtschenkoi TaxID=63787 RepID=A0A7N0RF16_KALFE
MSMSSAIIVQSPLCLLLFDPCDFWTDPSDPDSFELRVDSSLYFPRLLLPLLPILRRPLRPAPPLPPHFRNPRPPPNSNPHPFSHLRLHTTLSRRVFSPDSTALYRNEWHHNDDCVPPDSETTSPFPRLELCTNDQERETLSKMEQVRTKESVLTGDDNNRTVCGIYVLVLGFGAFRCFKKLRASS